MRDRDVEFHKRWLGLAQPIEGLVFSVPVLADAQIAPEVPPGLTDAFEMHLTKVGDGYHIRNLWVLFRDFLGYDQPGMLVARDALADELRFYAPEGGQEIRPSFALGRGPFANDDPFAAFGDATVQWEQDKEEKANTGSPDVVDEDCADSSDSSAAEDKAMASSHGGTAKLATGPSQSRSAIGSKYFALVWDLTDSGVDIDLDAAEAVTGPWRYAPTAKFERLLRQAGIPVGFLGNGAQLRLIYAPAGESTGHLTFRVEHMRRTDGRDVLAAMELLCHARRAYGAAPEHTLEGLLAKSRSNQAEVTAKLAAQVFEAVETLVAGFEQAAARDAGGERLDWLRPALETEGDHFYQGVLSVVLRLVFLLYSEDQGLLPVEHPFFAAHLSLYGLYERLSHDAGAHPESMHHRFGAYGHLLALFRAVYLGVKHGSLNLPARRGKLFDPNAYPFLEGGQPDWTAAILSPEERARVQPPSVDDGTIYRVMHRLVVFEGQRLSYRTLDVEQIGSVYESLMGYHVLRLVSPAVRIGKFAVWVETEALRKMSPTERARYLKEGCGLNVGPVQTLEAAIKQAGNDDNALLEALSPQAPGKKSDILSHRGRAGRLVLQPGEERRRTGSHYTPRSLTEKVVKRTLEPLLVCLGSERTAEQILQLKICDPAMGSGAFLVATCRELASEIVAAWTRAGLLERIIEVHGDAHLHARRLVAQKCLYGVDKNAAAVELAKLSLWLITLSKTLPFTFVDHALRHGDSLVGLDFRQIRAFHWSPDAAAAKQEDFCASALKEALEQAVDLRQQIVALAEKDDPSAQAEKRRLFEFSQQAIEQVRVIADVCVGAFFAQTKDTARDKERARRLDLLRNLFLLERQSEDVSRREQDREQDRIAAREARVALEALANEARHQLSPFHWWLEFPEVFFEERPDPLQDGAVNGAALMEGVVGNPPFMGGKGISGDYGDEYLAWLGARYPGSMNADICAYFFRRTTELLGDHGAFGLIATNTIAQGDTREAALQPLVEHGWIFFDATSRLTWPGPAAVTVSIVMGARGWATGKVELRLDGVVVPVINSRLKPTPDRPNPTQLSVNARAGYIGSYVLTTEGFTLSVVERENLVKRDAANAERTFPYLGGEEVNSSPTQSFERYVIDFGLMSMQEAQRWPDLFRRLEQKVRPERAKNKRDRYREIWWQFAEPQTALREALASLERCLVTSRHAKHAIFSFQPANRIFSEATNVFPLGRFTPFAILQSRVHTSWAWLLSSSMKSDLRYSTSDCFETFPFPNPDPGSVIPELETIGQQLYEARAKYMVGTNQGLTKTYNALKNPACDEPRILELRQMHEAMDRAVLAAYGWSDVEVPPYCVMLETDKERVQAFEDEVIDRLYVLNAERAREEERLGKAGGAAKAKSGSKTKGKTASAQSVTDGDDGSVAGAGSGKRTKGKKAPSAGGRQGNLF